VLLRSEANEHGPAERLAADNLEAVAEGNAEPGQVAQHLRVVGHAHEASRGAQRELVEAARRGLVDPELDSRDGVAVGIDRGIAQARGDQLLEVLAEHVLEHLGLGVHAVPGHA